MFKPFTSLLIVVGITAWTPAMAQDNACSTSTLAMNFACNNEVRDDYAESVAICININDEADRDECLSEALDAWAEESELCGLQAEARSGVCAAVGEARYDQSETWQAENFADPDDIGLSVTPNPWFDMTVGTRNEFFGDGETIIVEVTNETKLINGVRCRTVNDLVQEDGLNIEDTDDWYAQDLEGNVWYCGEISLNYEFYEGDDPEVAELVDIEGSWKAFRDGAQPGILVHANPVPGTTYRQEIAWGDAEDVAEVITVNGSELLEEDECENDDITADVAEHVGEMCAAGDCLITFEYTAIEPDAFAHKYYAPGTGIFLEVEDGACVATLGVIDPEDL